MAEGSYILLSTSTIFMAIIIFIIFFSKKKHNKLPPGPTGLPLFGSLFKLGSKPNESLASLARTYGPIMTLHLGFNTTVVVSSAKMAEEILQKNDNIFAGRTVVDAIRSRGHEVGSLVWNQVNPRWRAMRRLCNTEIFTTKQLDMSRELRQVKVHEMAEYIKGEAVAGRAVDVGRCAFVTSLNLVSNTVFSEDVVRLGSGKDEEFKKLVWDLMEAAGSPNLVDYFPALRLIDPQGLRRRVAVCFDSLHAIFDNLISKRVSSQHIFNSQHISKRKDFLDVLLEYTNSDGAEFSRQDMKPFLVDMFVAGSETNSTTVEWAMAELVKHPEKMSVAKAELYAIVGEDRQVEETDLPKLPYTHAIIKETLRLHTPAPFLIPHRADDTVDIAGYTIPKHTQVLVNAWAIGQDAETWKDPTSFSPERFIGSNINYKGQDFMFIPFGAGRRICPGLPLAMRMAQLIVATLVHSFSWELPNGAEAEELKMEDKFGITLRKATPLLLIAKSVK